MSENAAAANEILSSLIGKPPTTGDWLEVTQERVNDFADATLDHQFIHIDPDRAAETPFGGTIAHGFLTLSLIVHLGESAEADAPKLKGLKMGVNYGLNKVRFLNPVPVGSRIRANSETVDVKLKGSSIDQTKTMTVEIEGQERPALVADWIIRYVF